LAIPRTPSPGLFWRLTRCPLPPSPLIRHKRVEAVEVATVVVAAGVAEEEEEEVVVVVVVVVRSEVRRAAARRAAEPVAELRRA
jgi:hypothetical protein